MRAGSSINLSVRQISPDFDTLCTGLVAMSGHRGTPGPAEPRRIGTMRGGPPRSRGRQTQEETLMRAVVITEHGEPGVMQWLEVPDPVPAPDEVVIDVAAAGVNRADLAQREGNYPPPPGAPPYPGLEVSGRIRAVGSEVTGWQPGDEVCALLGGGGYAEQVAAPQGQVLPVPETVPVTAAAALPEVACT